MQDLASKVSSFLKIDYKFYIIQTGSSQISQIMQFGGCSKSIAGIEIPYSTEQIDRVIGYTPQKYCSKEVAEQFAIQAKIKGCDVGVGISSSLYKENQREGRENVSYISFVTDFGFKNDKIIHTGTRQEQEMQVIDKFFEIAKSIAMAENYVDEKFPFYSDKVCLTKDNNCPYIYCGAFNPWHEGHQLIYDHVTKNYGPCALAICMCHPLKGWITIEELLKRKSLLPKTDIFSDISPRFIDKPYNKTFVMGSDTFDRMLKWRHYTKEEHQQLQNLKFLVFERPGYPLNFYFNEDYGINYEIANVKGLDISSTDIRNNK